VRQWFAEPPEWIEAHTAPIPERLGLSSLGLGEREAIALAANRQAILLTDDMKARNAAESFGIRVVPTIRVLSTADALGMLGF
jgi:predicted nucleic acid-binding protein